jgi:mxaA protein
MKNPIRTLIVFGCLVLLSHTAIAQESAARILKIINPSHSNGIHIGDIMERKVVIEASIPYQISRAALPVKGTRQEGIELTNIQISTTQHDQKTLYEIALRYQVFAHAATPVVMQMPAETFALTGGPQALSVKLPGWRCWFAPLVVADIHTAKDNLQPQYKPSLINSSAHQYRLAVFLGLLLTGLLGLVYINADRRWLPFMNGPFAQAHRRIKRLPNTPAKEKQALISLHQAFNKVYGANLFAPDLAQFIAAHPEFAEVRAEIETFFEQSNKSLFAQASHDHAQFIADLIAFSKRLRDCERGVA